MSVLARLTNQQLGKQVRAVQAYHEETVERATAPGLTMHERQRRVKRERNARRALGRVKAEQWRRYEAEKLRLRNMRLSPEEYEAEIRRVTEELEL